MLAVAAPFVSMAMSSEPGPEVGEPPGGGEEDAASMAISEEPSPDEGEPSGGGKEDAVPMAISGEPSPEAGEPPRRRRGRRRHHGQKRRARPRGRRAPSNMANSLCVRFRPQRQPLLALGARWRLV
jgi:hypothetical protein